MTPAQDTRTTTLLSEYAKGETVEVEEMDGVIYGFTTELGALRIFAKYNSNGTIYSNKVRVGFSQNLQSWYVSIEKGF